MKNKNKQTKFPVARIKKIMQKDDDVGKVAQATPIVISKALELFLASIVEEAGKVTVERGSKKVEAYHLKHAVETTEMFDFLKEIVEMVPDPSAGGTIDLDAVASENAAKKKRSKGKKTPAAGSDGAVAAPKRRRKKVKSEEVAEDGEENGEDAAMADAEETNKSEQEGEDEDAKNGGKTSRRQRSDSEDDDWKNDAPYMPSSR